MPFECAWEGSASNINVMIHQHLDQPIPVTISILVTECSSILRLNHCVGVVEALAELVEDVEHEPIVINDIAIIISLVFLPRRILQRRMV